MIFIVVTTDDAEANARVASEYIRFHNPDSIVVTLTAGLRRADVDGRVVSGGAGSFDGFRWVDLSLGLGRRRAAWAAIPWILESGVGDIGASPQDPVVVIDDSFWVGGNLNALSGYDTLAARANHVDQRMGAWGGFLPGLLVVPPSRGWFDWWKQRALELAECPEPIHGPDPWWSLPAGSAAITDPAFAPIEYSATSSRSGAEAPTAAGMGRLLVDLHGFDPMRPWAFGAGDRAISAGPALRGLLEDHARRLLEAGWVPERGEVSLMPGVRVTDELRTWYRGLLAAGGAEELPANPLVPGEAEAFLAELDGRPGSARSGVTQHVDLLLARREDLRHSFPHPKWRDRRRFRNWLWGHGLSEGETSLVTLPAPANGQARRGTAPASGSSPAAKLPFGVNLVGYLDADLGLGVAARRMQAALDAAGIPNTTVSYDRTSSNLREAGEAGSDAPYHFNLLLITPDQLPHFVADAGPEFLEGHHNIGLWYWESDVVAPTQRAAFGLVDEVWVATHYLTRAFSGQGKPVSVVPSPLVFDQPEPSTVDRGRLGLDGRFTFLFSFDFLSEPERKNAVGLADAYRRAFPEPADTALVIKSINGHILPESLGRLRWEVADRDDVIVRDQLMPASDRLGLVAAADCYVSLHRSEGLGLTMAEAMAVGTPVIATSYSGNLDFMPPGSTLLVPATEVEVGPGKYYPPHGHWADPDLDAAAEMMRRVKADPSLRRDLASAGRRALEPFGYDQVGLTARDALLESWNTRS